MGIQRKQEFNNSRNATEEIEDFEFKTSSIRLLL